MRTSALLSRPLSCALLCALALCASACDKQSPGASDPDAAADPATDPASGTDADAGPAQGPAMWTVQDEDTTVYLFGTVHILPPELNWRTPTMEAAFDASKVVYFEADVASPQSQAQMMALIPEIGTYKDGQTLTKALSPEGLETVEAALGAIGLSMPMVDPMRPWLVAITIESQALVTRGYAPDSGVEMVLGKEAAAAGKELRYFETVEEQLGFFAELPDADQLEFLVQTAKSVQDEPDAIDELVAAWASGDVATLAALASEDDATSSKAITEAILTNRNRNWVGQLQSLLADEPGVFFIAVGAAHLAGDDGVPTMLRAAGVDVTGP